MEIKVGDCFEIVLNGKKEILLIQHIEKQTSYEGEINDMYRTIWSNQKFSKNNRITFSIDFFRGLKKIDSIASILFL